MRERDHDEPPSILISPDAIAAAMYRGRLDPDAGSGVGPITRFCEYLLHKNQKDADYNDMMGFRSAKVELNVLTGDIVISMSRKDAERGGEKVAMELLSLKINHDGQLTDAFLRPGRAYQPLNEKPKDRVEFRALKNGKVKLQEVVDRYASIYPEEFKKAMQYHATAPGQRGVAF